MTHTPFLIITNVSQLVFARSTYIKWSLFWFVAAWTRVFDNRKHGLEIRKNRSNLRSEGAWLRWKRMAGHRWECLRAQVLFSAWLSADSHPNHGPPLCGPLISQGASLINPFPTFNFIHRSLLSAAIEHKSRSLGHGKIWAWQRSLALIQRDRWCILARLCPVCDAVAKPEAYDSKLCLPFMCPLDSVWWPCQDGLVDPWL